MASHTGEGVEMYNFNYHKPTSISDAVKLFEAADDAVYLAGGHTLLPSMKQRLRAPSDVIDLSAMPGMTEIAEEPGMLVIGALVTHDSVASSAVVSRAIPALNHLAAGIGDAQVRNRGTIGGSIANSDPAADYPAAVLGLGAVVRTNQREIPGDDFFTGMFETALTEGELVTAIAFPIVERAAYEKFPNPASRYATVGVFISQHQDQVRVAVTGAAPSVFRSPEMEAALSREMSAASLDGVSLDAENMNSDLHASAEYRSHLCTVMAKRAVVKL